MVDIFEVMYEVHFHVWNSIILVNNRIFNRRRFFERTKKKYFVSSALEWSLCNCILFWNTTFFIKHTKTRSLKRNTFFLKMFVHTLIIILITSMFISSIYEFFCEISENVEFETKSKPAHTHKYRKIRYSWIEEHGGAN